MVKRLVTWGKRQNLAQIPQITSYVLDPDERIRASVALVLGKIITGQRLNLEVEEAIKALETLSQDSSSEVRKLAIKSLGRVFSPKIVPTLELALKDVDLEIIEIASEILQNYKRTLPITREEGEKTLPENIAIKEAAQ
ncbi:HEAT repeat domain-containing protein [Euhalothece natronophila Z-M001]|uniref:HEAT repeat domain-containing protein n=1 Tax=Euhalothece natronophila Z-M001 TaxID=522448 RepID=A0A5B8NQG8_9CHRO|nr:HEAT repeat domain-containing protein [Euhalothece natronophila Z-M001]